MTFDLDSPVGRRMVETAWQIVVDGERGREAHLPSVEKALAAALRVAMNDTCSNCKGRGQVINVMRDEPMIPCPNPDCEGGKVKPALMTREEADEMVIDAEMLAMKVNRANVVAEIVEALRSGNAGVAHRSMSADFIERREREREH